MRSSTFGRWTRGLVGHRIHHPLPGQFLLRSLAGEGGFGRPVPRTFSGLQAVEFDGAFWGGRGSLASLSGSSQTPKSVILWNEFVPVGKNGLAQGSFLAR